MQNITIRRFFSSPAGQPLLGRHSVTPIELYRIQTGVKVKLRDYDVQAKQGRTSFDVVLKDGLVHPAKGDNFIGLDMEFQMSEIDCISRT